MTAIHCKDYEHKGYCIRGVDCPFRHADDIIKLDISGYTGLIDTINILSAKLAVQSAQQQNELKRKQTDLLSNLICQQRALIEKIELCSDEAERLRLKSMLEEITHRTKEWLDEEGSKSKRTNK